MKSSKFQVFFITLTLDLKRERDVLLSELNEISKHKKKLRNEIENCDISSFEAKLTAMLEEENVLNKKVTNFRQEIELHLKMVSEINTKLSDKVSYL